MVRRHILFPCLKRKGGASKRLDMYFLKISLRGVRERRRDRDVPVSRGTMNFIIKLQIDDIHNIHRTSLVALQGNIIHSDAFLIVEIYL